ncbi:MAG TPA: hypothetical protein PLD95_04550 [bacterium]|jgi:hypothetical protein|nr:hypothetical protein [bacterium]HOG38705.1 hypothetical protein [bacterium]HQI03558.1 hypothetical protein [bacterium]
MDPNKFFGSKTFKIITGILLTFVIFLLGFQLGTMVGFKKAIFSYKWGENYHKNFAGPHDGFMRGMEIMRPENKRFIEPHGTIGEIIKIDNQSIIIKGQDNVEKIIIIKDDTAIRNLNMDVSITDLKVNDLIVVLGSPNDFGQIDAKLIRIIPKPENIPADQNK